MYACRCGPPCNDLPMPAVVAEDSSGQPPLSVHPGPRMQPGSRRSRHARRVLLPPYARVVSACLCPTPSPPPAAGRQSAWGASAGSGVRVRVVVEAGVQVSVGVGPRRGGGQAGSRALCLAAGHRHHLLCHTWRAGQIANTTHLPTYPPKLHLQHIFPPPVTTAPTTHPPAPRRTCKTVDI